MDKNNKNTNRLPIFSDYPVQAISTSTLPTIDLASNSLGSEFKTRISEINKTSPNFAGKYSIGSWGCGSNCQIGVLINRSNGKILGNTPPDGIRIRSRNQ